MKKEMNEREILLQIMRSGAEQSKYFLRFYQGADQLAADIYRAVLDPMGW